MQNLRSLIILAALALFMTGGDCSSSDGSGNSSKHNGQDASHSSPNTDSPKFGDGGDTNAAPIPEPSSALIFAVGLLVTAGGLSVFSLRKRKQESAKDRTDIWDV